MQLIVLVEFGSRFTVYPEHGAMDINDAAMRPFGKRFSNQLITGNYFILQVPSLVKV